MSRSPQKVGDEGMIFEALQSKIIDCFFSNTSEKKEASKKEKRFDHLLWDYSNIIDLTQGYGESGQKQVDQLHIRLEEFTNHHPEFYEQLPKKYKVHNDGSDGYTTTINRYVRRKKFFNL